MKHAFFALVILLIAATALADGIPDLYNSFTTCAYEGDGTVSVVVIPDGSGALFSEARDEEGNLVDATLMLTVLDGWDNPIALFPREDMWIESADGGLVPCIGGTIADVDTDLEGQTWWAQPLRASGFSEAGCRAFVNGNAVLYPELEPIVFNSPDINGDGEVNLMDVGQFASDLFTGYHFRSDFLRDGILNLADVGWLARGLGRQCD